MSTNQNQWIRFSDRCPTEWECEAGFYLRSRTGRIVHHSRGWPNLTNANAANNDGWIHWCPSHLPPPPPFTESQEDKDEASMRKIMPVKGFDSYEECWRLACEYARSEEGKIVPSEPQFRELIHPQDNEVVLTTRDEVKWSGGDRQQVVGYKNWKFGNLPSVWQAFQRIN